MSPLFLNDADAICKFMTGDRRCTPIFDLLFPYLFLHHAPNKSCRAGFFHQLMPQGIGNLPGLFPPGGKAGIGLVLVPVRVDRVKPLAEGLIDAEIELFLSAL